MVKATIFAVVHPVRRELAEPDLPLETALLASPHPSPVEAPPTDSPEPGRHLEVPPAEPSSLVVEPAPGAAEESPAV